MNFKSTAWTKLKPKFFANFIIYHFYCFSAHVKIMDTIDLKIIDLKNRFDAFAFENWTHRRLKYMIKFHEAARFKYISYLTDLVPSAFDESPFKLSVIRCERAKCEDIVLPVPSDNAGYIKEKFSEVDSLTYLVTVQLIMVNARALFLIHCNLKCNFVSGSGRTHAQVSRFQDRIERYPDNFGYLLISIVEVWNFTRLRSLKINVLASGVSQLSARAGTSCAFWLNARRL